MGSGNGLVLVMHQTITRIDDDQDLQYCIVSLHHKELTYSTNFHATNIHDFFFR